LDPALPVILVTGGSQGARHINQVIADALPTLLSYCQVLHVSGEGTYEETRSRAESALASAPDAATLRPRYALFAYLKTEMPQAIAASDVVICRSGASTLTELALIGRASLLIPLPPGFGGSPQAVNAAMFQQAGAADVILDRDMTPTVATERLRALLDKPDQRVRMAAAAQTFALPNAARDLADAVVTLARRAGAAS
jgi:UDP-N-acetylglucosamine--N-acetylmuramyl-(pentapeptide) pyrophosphoryl-undecaprenol N-acetylglucosamine transferase